MKLKEKTAARQIPETKPMGTAAEILISAALGFLAAGTKLGGNGAPLCVSAAAALPFTGGTAAFAGAMVNFILNGSLGSRVTEIVAMPAVTAVRALLSAPAGKKVSPAVSGGLAAAAYTVCGLIAAFAYNNVTAALVMAVIFRGILSGAAAYFGSEVFLRMRSGSGLDRDTALPAAVTYILTVCMLSEVSFGTFDLGRIAGTFATLAAAFRYGFGGGAAVGALSAFAFGMAAPSMASTAAIVVCSGLASGFFAQKNKLAASASFIVTALAGALFYGMPSGVSGLLADVTAGAAAFYIVPEKLYGRRLGAVTAPSSAASEQFSRRLRFAAESVADVRQSFTAAADVLEKNDRERDITAMVCEKVCASCKSGAFCGESPAHRREAFFRPAERVLRSKGFITEKDLPDALEHCPKKAGLLNAFNEGYRLWRLERRLEDQGRGMRELTAEQLEETEDMLRYLGGEERRCDEALSERAADVLSEEGAKEPAAAAFFDGGGRLFIECYCEGELPANVRDRLREISDRELAEPVTASAGGLTRTRFHELAPYEAEIGIARAAGGKEPSGDSDAVFRDGLGNLFVLISDGMGSGVRAAVESRMTVSVMTRAIRAGLGADAAVKLINGLLMTKSAEEIFATADLLRINLFTGRAELLKLGAAQTFVKTNGAVRTVESRTTPLGIVDVAEIDKRSVMLSDGDEVVMITDGVTEDCFPRVRELMLSAGVTAQDCADRVIAEAEKNRETDPCAGDDKTVAAVKLHRI